MIRRSAQQSVRLAAQPRRRVLSASAALITFLSLLVVAPSWSAATPPPNPTNAELQQARAHKAALADRVGVLSGQIAAMQSQLQALQGEQELAEQKYAYALSLLQQAKDAAVKAAHNVVTAQQNVDAAQQQLIIYVQGAYMSGSGTTGDSTETLLTAPDPSALLERGAIESYQADHQIDAVGTMQRATVAKSNADAAARLAVQNQKKATDAAKQAQIAAKNAVEAAQAQTAQLQSTMKQSQAELLQAQTTLATLNNQRATFLAYQAEQARLRAERLRRERLARERAERIARERAQHGGGGGGGGGGSSPPPPSGGSWTASKGRTAANRALSELGMPYAWAGGNAYGPTRGVCDPSNGAPNDCNVTGFDCSGLAMYAWGISWAHYAATQYYQVGSFHPNADELMPGDLVFWSFNGSVSGIHHVAIFIGDQTIVEAPYSGGFVQRASLYEYGSFFGATRPLS